MFDFSSGLMLSNADLMGINGCFVPSTREYGKGKVITVSSSDYDKVGIVKSGLVYLITENADSQRRIVDYFQPGDWFGIRFLSATDEKLYFLSAKTKCKIDYIKYNKLINCCEKHCKSHSAMIDKLISQTARRSSVHLDIAGQRTLRNKLMTFFWHLQSQANSKTFTVPLPYSDVADYLGVDRSAMMRELKRLAEEKIIATNKRKVTIL